MNYLKQATIIALLFSQFLTSYAQEDLNQVFSAKDVCYYGVDFSNFKLEDQSLYSDRIEIKEKIFAYWNKYLISEVSEVYLARWLRKDNAYYDFSPVYENIKKINPDSIIGIGQETFGADLISTTIKNLTITNPKCELGLVILAQKFVKKTDLAHVYYVFFDTKSRKVLSSEKQTGKAGSFWLGRYWGLSLISSTKLYVDRNYLKKYRTWKKSK